MTTRIEMPQQLELVRRYPVLYHGTSEAALPKMVVAGIVPRGLLKSSGNWKHSIESNPDTAYLTDAYAHYFAFSAVEPNRKESGVVLRINTAALANGGYFVPDEDALEQATRGREVTGTPSWMKNSNDFIRRTRWYRKHAACFDPMLSLLLLGTVGFRGTIPWSAVLNVAVLPHDLMCEAVLAFDPTITVLNYKLLGDRYRTFMRSLFEHDYDAKNDGMASIPFTPRTVRDLSSLPSILSGNEVEWKYRSDLVFPA